MILQNTRPYSEKWDKLLNKLLDTHVKVEKTNCVLKFTILTETPKCRWWLLGYNLPVKTYDVYEVWIANKYVTYGHLHAKNRHNTPNVHQYSPKADTLRKLCKFECSMVTNIDYDYSN